MHVCMPCMCVQVYRDWMANREELLTERPQMRRAPRARALPLLQAGVPACGPAEEAAWPPQLLATFRARLHAGAGAKAGMVSPTQTPHVLWWDVPLVFELFIMSCAIDAASGAF